MFGNWWRWLFNWGNAPAPSPTPVPGPFTGQAADIEPLAALVLSVNPFGGDVASASPFAAAIDATEFEGAVIHTAFYGEVTQI